MNYLQLPPARIKEVAAPTAATVPIVELPAPESITAADLKQTGWQVLNGSAYRIFNGIIPCAA